MPDKKTKEGQVVEIEARTLSDDGSIPMQLMDSYDDELILSDIKGMMAASDFAEKWVYKFMSSEGKEVTGLSWVGTKEIRYWMAKKGLDLISEIPESHKLEEKIINGAMYLDCTVGYENVFTDPRTGKEKKIRTTATIRQPYVGKKRGGGTYAIDPAFVPRIAESKAQRNAIQKLIPADTLTEFIKFAVSKGKVETLAIAKSQVELTPDEMKIAAPYFSQVESLATYEDCKAYYAKINTLTKDLDAKISLAIKRAVEIKGTFFKNLAATEKVKAMSEKKTK